MSATIFDVAEKAGVSTATVSKVFSGKPYVSEKTRARVLAVAEALQYSPNHAARSLASGRSNTIGVVIAYDPRDLFADPSLLQVVYGVDLEVTERDYSLLLSTARSTNDSSAYARLIHHDVDGILAEGSMLGIEGERILASKGVPCVIFGYSATGLPSVYPDDYHGARRLIAHLLELGHRRIGIISGLNPERSLAVQARLRGVQDVLEGVGMSIRPDLIVPGTYRTESGYAGAAQLMARPEPPTAIFAMNDRMALGVLRWLREHGYRVPHDISVVGFDDIADAAQFDPPLTTVRLPTVAIGQRAATLLFDLIAGKDPEPAPIVLPTELIIRASTARLI